jgi:hypothetical protein
MTLRISSARGFIFVRFKKHAIQDFLSPDMSEQQICVIFYFKLIKTALETEGFKR